MSRSFFSLRNFLKRISAFEACDWLGYDHCRNRETGRLDFVYFAPFLSWLCSWMRLCTSVVMPVYRLLSEQRRIYRNQGFVVDSEVMIIQRERFFRSEYYITLQENKEEAKSSLYPDIFWKDHKISSALIDIQKCFCEQ